MHNERCTSGSEGGHQNPTAAMPHGADARPYSPNGCRMEDGFRVLTVVDQFTRECLTLHADTALSGEKVAMALSKIVGTAAHHSRLLSTTALSFHEAMDLWAYTNGVHLDFIRPGRPVRERVHRELQRRLRETSA